MHVEIEGGRYTFIRDLKRFNRCGDKLGERPCNRNKVNHLGPGIFVMEDVG